MRSIRVRQALHWTLLHTHRLCESTPDWFKRWLKSVPEHGCNCKPNVLGRIKKAPPDFADDHAWFRWGWQLHNFVSKEHAGNPTISLDDAYSIHWPQAGNAGVVAVTALSRLPNHRAVQTRCLDSWQRIGLRVIASNTSEEIRDLRPLYPQVEQWIAQDEVSTDYDYPTQLIHNLIHLADRLGEPIWLINSDIEIRGRAHQMRIPTDHVRVGIRWDHDGDYTLARQFRWGLDAFTFTPEQSRWIPEGPFAIGQAMWDYWLPWLLRESGVRLEFEHARQFWHRRHSTNWNRQGWEFGCSYIAARGGPGRSEFAHSWRQTLQPELRYCGRTGRYVPA